MSLSDVLGPSERIAQAVILLGDTDPESCAADLKRSEALNVDSVVAVIRYLTGRRIKPVFISSELVFDGTKGGYTESDPVNPVLTYGRQKVEVEKYLRSFCDSYAVVRLAKVFGGEPGGGTLFTRWLAAIERGETIRCATDQIFSPIFVDDAAEGIVRLIDADAGGLFHLAGAKAYRRIELLEMLLSRLNGRLREDVKVVRCSIHDFKLREKRPLDVSMRPDKFLEATGMKLKDAETICAGIVLKARHDSIIRLSQ